MWNNTCCKLFLFLILVFSIKGIAKAQSVNELKKRKLIVGLTQGIDNTKNQSNLYSTDCAFYILNSSLGAVNKLQFSLLNNFTYKYNHGIQIAAVSNVAGQNINRRKSDILDYVLKGVQISAFINRIEGNGLGFQSSLLNVVKGSFTGVQIGLNNKTDASLNGFSLGMFNHSSGFNGVQLSLFSNISTSYGAGLQIAPFNFSKNAGFVSNRSIEHFQLGILNVAPSNSGLQVGLINISKKNSGLPIGVFNFGATDGAISISSDELITSKIMLGTGGENFLNRLGVGYNFLQNQLFDWSFSYGFEFNSHTDRIYDYGFFNDFIFLRSTEKNWYDGFWVNRLGFLFVFQYFGDRFFPILTTVHMNASTSNELGHNLNFRIGEINFWPGLSIGIRY